MCRRITGRRREAGAGYGGGYYALPVAAAAGAVAAADSAASSETVPHGKLEATAAQNNALNQKWLEYYKSAAMIGRRFVKFGKSGVYLQISGNGTFVGIGRNRLFLLP